MNKMPQVWKRLHPPNG